MSAASHSSGEAGEPVEVPVDPESVPPGQATVLHAAGREVAVFNLHGRLVAVDHRCPHRRGPLGEGVVRHGVLTCPWHWYRFDLNDGRCLNHARLELRHYPVVERDGQTCVRVTPAPTARSWRETLLAAARGEHDEEEGQP